MPNEVDSLPESWSVLQPEIEAEYFRELSSFVESERSQHEVYPARDKVFAAFDATTYEDVRVLILGQDPYHGAGQAHGLCFSVQRDVKIPPSLRNIYKELANDIGCEVPQHGNLTTWAKQGILLLNTVLTVRANEANSHRKRGWEQFTDSVIRAINEKPEAVVFVLWGAPAQKKKKLIDAERHVVIESAHPSPLSAHRGFLGSRPFSRINEALKESGRGEIDWSIPAD